MKKKVLVSGIQSSGRLHIGNYFGAMRQNIALSNSDEFEPYVFIADYHSMTSLTNADERRKYTFDLACAYLACGLDTNKVTLFKQSDVPEHTELSWIFATMTPMPMLMLSHAFKDKVSVDFSLSMIDDQGRPEGYHPTEEEAERMMEHFFDIKYRKINAGLFTYPVLMAADILMYNADIVPVGSDQKQHVEMTRELAGKFNRTYCRSQIEIQSSYSDNIEAEGFFKMPQAYIMPEVAIVPGTDGEKMSKSKGNVIPLFGTDAEIKKAVMSIVTDTKAPNEVVNPDENNIYNIHKLFLSGEKNRGLHKEKEDFEKEGSLIAGESLGSIEDLRNRFLKAGKYEGGNYSYKEAKEALCEAIIAFVGPMRESYDYYQSHHDEVYAILENGKIKAQTKARETMNEVRDIVGLNNN